MPVSIVIGGQFGSEGKGKVALEIVRRAPEPVVAVRVGGPNSGHTAYDRHGRKHVLRQLPAACIDRDVDVVLPAGSYIDVSVLLDEIERLDYPGERIKVSAQARIITEAHREWERQAGLGDAIGSTGSGVGAAVMASVSREARNFHLLSKAAEDDSRLSAFIVDDTSRYLRQRVEAKCRVVVEGTQGFGLSLLDGGYWPKATSRPTTAAAALAEAGLSPVDVDDVTMVIRSFPIRVSGKSGPLVKEITWEEVAAHTGQRTEELREYTTVTGRLRRVGKFDADLVRRALDTNRPTRLALNHLDYIGPESDLGNESSKLAQFIRRTESCLGRKADWYGFSPSRIVERKAREHA